MSDLKPCPFCGGVVNWCDCGNCPRITCPKCGQFDLVKAGETLEGAKQEAETTWNNRPFEQRLAAAEAKIPRWIPYTEGDQVEDGDYLLSVAGDVTEASYETSKDLDVLDSGFFDECGWEYIPDAYMKKPKPYNPYDAPVNESEGE